MAVTRASKEAQLKDLEGAFAGVETAILVDYRGLDVPQVTELRRQLRAVKAEYRVVKNTLARRALKGTAFEPLDAFFVGTTAVAYTGDDLPDLAVMQRVGFSIAVANAHPWVRERAHWRTRLAGGAGAAREVADLILAAQGRAESELAAFERR